ncbi:MAG: amidohydrolase 3, partial [Rhizorhabdus sp.]|nr:amidohydrolase 3 [Rhizorhabdus sp.]
EGLPWNWETFPQYLDALEARAWDVDVAAYVPHSPLRVHVMGQRGLDREPATADDLARMAALVEEGMAAGALGFATSRTLVHRTGTGDQIPSFDADSAELEAMAEAVGRSGRGVVQMVPNLGSPLWRDELDMLVRLGERSGRPVTFSLAQSHEAPEVWRAILDRVAHANATLGTRLAPQVYPRPMGVVAGLSASSHPFCLCPSYQAIETLPLAERVAAMRDPALRARLLSETPADPANPLFRLVRNFDRIYPMAAIPDYEPQVSVAALAHLYGMTPEALAYDLLLEDEGRALLYVPFSNYADANLDAVRAMLADDASVIGLGDGGAHYGLICDASYGTTLLCHWTRDRESDRLPLPWAIKRLTADTADLMGLADRGRIAPGLKADINLIDHAALTLHRPRAVHDLPGGGRRLVQDADGYRMTILSGVVVQEDGEATGALPGRLVRGS